jgi:NitT/TauT family transport system substrate-binding protein
VAGTANGRFAAHGLNVTLLEPAPGPENVRRVAEGGADVCLTSVNHYVAAREQFGELPARFVAVVSRQLPISGLVRADSPLRTAQDLAGRRLGGSLDNGLTRELLEALELLDVEPPELVEIPYDAGPGAVARGDVDLIADFAEIAPRAGTQAGTPIRPIRVGGPFYASGIVAGEHVDESVVTRLRSALVDVLEEQRQDPSTGLAELTGRYPGVQPDVAVASWQLAAESIFTGEPVGEMSVEPWAATLDHASRVHRRPLLPAASVYRDQFLTPARIR